MAALVLVAPASCRTLSDEYTNPSPDGGTGTLDGSVDGGPIGPPVVNGIAGVVVDTFAGADQPGNTEGTGGAARFDNPVGVALDATGALLVAEYDGGRIRRVAPDGQTTLIVGGLLDAFGLLATPNAIFVQTDRDRNGRKGVDTSTLWRIVGDKAEVVVDGLGRPRGIAQLPDGRIVVADRSRHTLSMLNPADKTFTPLVGGGVPGLVDGVGRNALFNEPYGVAILPDGNIIVADSANNCIRRVTLDGEVTTIAGDGTIGMRDDPNPRLVRFNKPQDVVADIFGNIYVSDVGNHRIRRLTTAGIVETVAGSGALGFADGPGLDAQFFAQEQLEVSPDGKTIYVADGTGGEVGQPYNRVRRMRIP